MRVVNLYLCMLNICKKMADDDRPCDTIVDVTCHFCLVEAEDIICLGRAFLVHEVFKCSLE